MEQLLDFVMSLRFTEGLCLLPKNGGNGSYGIDRVTILEEIGKWMLDQFYARLLFVILQGGLKEQP